MNFMQLLQTLDNLLYEVMSWLVFFPITLWRTFTRPLSMMEYADSALHDRLETRYEDTLSPPLFLMLALLVAHALGLALGDGVNPIVASQRGLAAYIDSDSKLLLLRMVLFSIIPLMLAAGLLVGLHRPVTREGLKAPFYAQCYPAGAFALALGIGTQLVQHEHNTVLLVGRAIMIIAPLAYFTLQLAWFRRHLRRGMFAATFYAGMAIFLGLGFAIIFALLFI